MLDEVLALHAEGIARFGGSLGVRDPGLLQSALAMPEASFDGEWLHPTIEEMAAAYLFHLCKKHPFLDGNKRAALATAAVFLGLNGLSVIAPDDALYAMVIGVADGGVSKAEVAVFWKRHSQRRSSAHQ